MRGVAISVVLVCVLCAAGGCGGKTVEGSVKIESTDAFKKMKSTKSPPPQKPQK
jgi:hypothetical protein